MSGRCDLVTAMISQHRVTVERHWIRGPGFGYRVGQVQANLEVNEVPSREATCLATCITVGEFVTTERTGIADAGDESLLHRGPAPLLESDRPYDPPSSRNKVVFVRSASQPSARERSA